MQSWLEGRNWVGKCAQATGRTVSLRILSNKADLNTWEGFKRSELKLESVSPRSDIFRKRATKPLLKQRHRQKHLTWAKEKKNWTVAQWSKVLFSDESTFWKSRSQSLEEEWRGPESMLLEVQCEVSIVCYGLGCHVICWCWSSVISEVHSQHSHLPGHFRALHASFCWQALWRCWFHFPAGLGTCTQCQRYQKLVQWPWCYCAWLASKLAWPEPHRESIWETSDPTMQTWRPLSKQPGLPLHLSNATGWLSPCHAALMQYFMQKEDQPSIECIEMNILFRNLTFLFKISFLLILCNILLSYIICKP